jgi:hypothetical protein
MEIEHLGTLSKPPGSAATEKPHDWKAMEKHFRSVHRQCPALESVGASEAILSWLDYYSPELFVRLDCPTAQTGAAKSRSPSVRFPIRFLGEGILGEEERIYRLVVSLPGQEHGQFQTVRILRESSVLLEKPFRPRTPLLLELALSERNQGHFVLELGRN